MGISVRSVVVVAVVAACFLLEGSSAVTHVVGDNSGWIVPTATPTLYSDWASKQTFAVGDILVFNFQAGGHTVVEVPKSGYDGCTAQNKIGAIISTGPANITITSTGDHYYICTIPGHCLGGQKLAITLGSSPSPVADGPTTTTPPTPTAGGGGSNSAFRTTAAGFSVVLAALLSIAASFF